MNATYPMSSHGTYHSNSVFLPSFVLVLCILISFKWISPLVLKLVWSLTKNPMSVVKVSESVKNDGKKLKQAYIRTQSTYIPSEHEERVETTTRYDEDWFNSPRIFNLEQRSIFSKVCLLTKFITRGKKGSSNLTTCLDLALRHPSLPLRQARRLPHPNTRLLLHLPNFRPRSKAPRIPQRMPPPCLHRNQKSLWFFHNPRM